MNSANENDPSCDFYIAAVLDNLAQERLRSFVREGQPNVFCHHVTLAFRPGPKIQKRYEALVGKSLLIEVMAIASDEHGCAVSVQLPPTVPCEKRFPHVTISTAKGIEPQYSYMLLREKRHQARLSLVLNATVEKIFL